MGKDDAHSQAHLPHFENRNNGVINGLVISVRRIGDGFLPGLFNKEIEDEKVQIFVLVGILVFADKVIMRKNSGDIKRWGC